jgi:hypothetical protein
MEASDFGPVPMNQYQSLRYSLGFLLGESHERVAGHFRRIDFPRPLATHPRTRIAVAESLAGPLAILGQVVHPDLPHLDLDGIAKHLAGRTADRQQEIDKLVGRFAVIQVNDAGDLRIQTDAIGLRSVFFSVCDDGVIAGSHSRLVAEARGERMRRRPFRWGYPGMQTPYPTVRRLPANLELSLAHGTLHRFFPTTAIPEVAIEDAWDVAFDRAGIVIAALARREKVLVSLTGGLDSRTTLAASRSSWPRLQFFTYNRGDVRQRVDNNVAADLARILDLRHSVVRYKNERDPAMLRIVTENAFTSHQRRLACAYYRHFGEHRFLHIRSNLLELGRANLFYKFSKRPRFSHGPGTARSMAGLYTLAAKLGRESSEHVMPAFEQYVAATDFESTLGKASPWDMYFVEHRMGAWQGGVVLESDISFNTVIAFNSREVVRYFMGVPQEIRCSSPHLRERLEALLPEVKDIPINPRRYDSSELA